MQRDAMVVASLGAHPLGAVTAITAQNTSKFLDVYPVEASSVSGQLESILSDFDIHAIKIGMVWDAAVMDAVHDSICNLDAPVVLDPVVRSTTGGDLLKENARRHLVRRLMPLARITTPNVMEAAHLTSIQPRDTASIEIMAHRISDMGSVPNVVITGARSGERVMDVLYVANEASCHHIKGQMINAENRGGGCTYSAALAFHIGRGVPVRKAAEAAQDVVRAAISRMKNPGRGIGVVHNNISDAERLSRSIDTFCSIPDIHRLVPECQTNFVCAPAGAITPDEVLGIRGRIVRTGDAVVRAGDITAGGSKHVATALCAIWERFPEIRSAVNIRYNSGTISAMVLERMVVAFYDRSQEPAGIKESGSSIAWGVSQAIKYAKEAPDVICHRGDFGKEPMCIVFGATPDDVVAKTAKISDQINRNAQGR